MSIMKRTATESEQKLEDWLSAHSVKWTIAVLGDACPPYCEDKGKPGIGSFPRRTHIHGRHHNLTLTRSAVGRVSLSLIVNYWNSYRDAERDEIGCECIVSVSEVLSCCDFFIADTFEDFANEFGYDPDSRKAEAIYRLRQDQVRDFRRMFTPAELEELAQLKGDL